MSIQSRLRNEKKPNPVRQKAAPGVFIPNNTFNKGASFHYMKEKTRGAFGKCKLNRKPRDLPFVPAEQMAVPSE
jgi:hypothetical protein